MRSIMAAMITVLVIFIVMLYVFVALKHILAYRGLTNFETVLVYKIHCSVFMQMCLITSFLFTSQHSFSP